jgi:hypothetical protein
MSGRWEMHRAWRWTSRSQREAFDLEEVGHRRWLRGYDIHTANRHRRASPSDDELVVVPRLPLVQTRSALVLQLDERLRVTPKTPNRRSIGER